MTLKYKIENQILRPVGAMRHTIELSRNFVFLELAFDAEWDGANITVLFSNDFVENGQPYKKSWTGEPVAVPPEVLVTGTLRLGCVGLRDGGETRITTSRMDRGVYIHRSGGVIGIDPEGQTPELWEQALAAIGQLGDLQTDDKSSLVAAINEVLSHGGGGTIDPSTIAQAVEAYLAANPPESGQPGQAATLQITGADALPAGAAPTVTEEEGSTDQNRIIRIGIPSGKDGEPGKPGAAGGYYAPTITQPDTNTMRIGFEPSDATMPEIEDRDITLPQGPQGTAGKTAYQYAKDGGYTGTEKEFAAKLASEMPDKLPNPQPLTFEGAVDATYDGSEAKTVTIPSGGSGGSGGAAKVQQLIDVTFEEASASVSITLDHNYHRLFLVWSCGVNGVARTVDADGNAVSAGLGVLIDATSWSWNNRKIGFIGGTSNGWRNDALLMEWTEDASTYISANAWQIDPSAKQVYSAFGGDSVMAGTIGTEESIPTKGKTLNVVTQTGFFAETTRIILVGEYYE